ncbi:MAG: tryptophan--tRNA ligase [Candidatus Omnitrophica bacterium]|nr:tryptophan--tRNA ligase [Candidatus Omnitrophota bacterium]
MKKRILSGMRPTGPLHLGHLVGALNNWIKLQEEYDCFYMVADWHALMSEYAYSDRIKDFVINCVVDWISCGLDPEKSTIFVQSHVPEHLELDMMLSCLTPLARLERNPTYKEQLREIKQRDLTTYAFLGYPVLQAADILVYKANVVPVGVDQAAHLELTREIVRRFNRIYGPIFPEPTTLLTESPKLLGTDGRKMSKSFGNFIALSDEPKVIKEKVGTMFTDPKRVYRKDKGHPHKCNICNYFKIFAPDRADGLAKSCKNADIGCTDCKKNLSDLLVETLKPIQEKRKALLSDKGEILNILKMGGEKAREAASKTMKEVRSKVGLL